MGPGSLSDLRTLDNINLRALQASRTRTLAGRAAADAWLGVISLGSFVDGAESALYCRTPCLGLVERSSTGTLRTSHFHVVGSAHERCFL